MDIFSQQTNIIEEVNIYGGRTVEHILNNDGITRTNISRSITYHNSFGGIVKSILEPIDEVINRTGIKLQIQHYRNGVIEKYEMLFTDGYYKVYGFNRAIEEVDTRNVVTRRIWYYNDIILDVSESLEDRFEFYNIEFIENEFFQGFELISERGDIIINTSARYVRIRSVITFGTELLALTDDEIMLLESFSRGFGAEGFSQYFSKKVRVYSENNSYWLYVQTELEQFILGQKATIRYYPIGFNGELYLICVGFFNIR